MWRTFDWYCNSRRRINVLTQTWTYSFNDQDTRAITKEKGKNKKEGIFSLLLYSLSHTNRSQSTLKGNWGHAESILSAAQLSHSVDAGACYIIWMLDENLMFPNAQLSRDWKKIYAVSTKNHKNYWIFTHTQWQQFIIGLQCDECVL